MRRTLMFRLTLAMLGLWFFGWPLLEQPLRKTPVAFLLFWTGVTGLALGLILLSGYDMLQISRETRSKDVGRGTPPD
ncbi:MAG: hypothetical protein ABL994_21845 [Verrucomicrobiales bacterium]